MKNKVYPKEITDEILSIAKAIKAVFDKASTNIRTISKFAGISVNSVKSVLSGDTANIASYGLVAKALGTNLIDVIHSLKTSQMISTPTP